MNYIPILTIAGSDSGGCAGIQADIKAISACGGYAASAITATTAQNTQGVTDIHPIPVAHLDRQLAAVFSDIKFAAVKIGMLHSVEVIDCVAKHLAQAQVSKLVLDPVMVANSGDVLITQEAIAQLKKLFAKVQLITPNMAEAELLYGNKITANNAAQVALELGQEHQTSVLLKGCRGQDGAVTDILFSAETGQTYCFSHPYVDTKHTHGTGCSLSSAIATYLARGEALEQAVELACDYVYQALLSGKDKQLGHGCGPIDHFFALPNQPA